MFVRLDPRLVLLRKGAPGCALAGGDGGKKLGS